MWLFYALLAPAVYAITNYVDKYIIEKELEDYSIVPIYTAITGLVVGTLFWIFSGRHLLGFNDGLLVLASGVITLISLVVYFRAMAEENASNIIILFQMTPVITLVLAYLFLKETITAFQFIGFLAVLSAALAVSMEEGTAKLELSKAFWLILIYDFLWAVSIILIKFAIDLSSFSKVLSYESWGIAIGGLGLFLLVPSVRNSFINSLHTLHTRTIGILFLNEIIYVLAKSLTFFAYTLGPAMLINVIGSSQVFFGIAYGTCLTLLFPAIFKEDLRKESILHKLSLSGILLLGIWLIYAV